MRLAHKQITVVLLVSKQYFAARIISQIVNFRNKQLEEFNDTSLVLDPPSCLPRKARH